VAPVAGRVADGEEDGPAALLCERERLGAPGEPVDRVVRVLLEVGARLPDEVVALAADLLDRARRGRWSGGRRSRVRVTSAEGEGGQDRGKSDPHWSAI